MNKLIVLTAALVASVAAKADETYQYLYWQVQPEQVADGVDPYNAAYFYVLDGNDVKTPIGGTAWNEMQVAGSRTASGIIGSIDLSGYSTGGYSFLWELANMSGGSGDVVGKSSTYSFSDLSSMLTSVKGGSNIPTQSVLSPSFYAVPEPTSGLLMLLGIAGLALRRKRA